MVVKKCKGSGLSEFVHNSSVSNLYVYSDEGAYIMDASTYKEREDATYAGLFNSVVTLDAVNPQAHVYETDHRRMDVLVNNHKVYAIAYIMMGESQYSEAKGVDDYVAAPAIAPVRIAAMIIVRYCLIPKTIVLSQFPDLKLWRHRYLPEELSIRLPLIRIWNTYI